MRSILNCNFQIHHIFQINFSSTIKDTIIFFYNSDMLYNLCTIKIMLVNIYHAKVILHYL